MMRSRRTRNSTPGHPSRKTSAKGSKRRRRQDSEASLAPDVRDRRRLLRAFLDSTDEYGRKIGNATCGIYAFFDFDGAAIYVGQTQERLRVRILRHLFNYRTDAVAMKVLDPMEVASVRVWPFWNLQTKPAKVGESEWKERRTALLDRAEWTAFSLLNAKQGELIDILNERDPGKRRKIALPAPHEALIIEPSSRERLYHPDERIMRRASTIASLAQIIKERDPSLGLRRTLMRQAERLLALATKRFHEIEEATPPQERHEELVGNEAEDIGAPRVG